MKKLLTTVSLCLFIVLCLVLAGCPAGQGVTVQSVQSDPVSALNSALEKANGGFAADETGVLGIIAAAMEKGSFGVSADLSDLVGASVNLVGYTDMSAKRMHYNLDLAIGGKTANDIKLYVDPNGMIFHAPQLFGRDDALRFDLDTAAGIIAPGAEQDPATLSIIETLKSSMASMFERDPAKGKEMLTEMFTTLGYTVTETTYDGEEIVQLTLNITSDKLATLICDLIDDTNYDAATKAEAKEGVQEAVGALELAAKVEFHILKANGVLLDAIFSGSFAMDTPEDPNAPDAIEFTVGYKSSNSEINIFANLTAVVGDQKSEAGRIELNVKKTAEGNKLTYTTKIEATMSDITARLATLTFDYDKGTGDYTLTLDVGDFFFTGDPTATGGQDHTIRLSGKMQKTDNKATLTLGNFAMQNFGPEDITLPLNISIYFEKGTAIPAAPTNPTDISTLTQQDILEMEEHLVTFFPTTAPIG